MMVDCLMIWLIVDKLNIAVAGLPELLPVGGQSVVPLQGDHLVQAPAQYVDDRRRWSDHQCGKLVGAVGPLKEYHAISTHKLKKKTIKNSTSKPPKAHNKVVS